jgi:hypothetical protein
MNTAKKIGKALWGEEKSSQRAAFSPFYYDPEMNNWATKNKSDIRKIRGIMLAVNLAGIVASHTWFFRSGLSITPKNQFTFPAGISMKQSALDALYAKKLSAIGGNKYQDYINYFNQFPNGKYSDLPNDPVLRKAVDDTISEGKNTFFDERFVRFKQINDATLDFNKATDVSDKIKYDAFFIAEHTTPEVPASAVGVVPKKDKVDAIVPTMDQAVEKHNALYEYNKIYAKVADVTNDDASDAIKKASTVKTESLLNTEFNPFNALSIADKFGFGALFFFQWFFTILSAFGIYEATNERRSSRGRQTLGGALVQDQSAGQALGPQDPAPTQPQPGLGGVPLPGSEATITPSRSNLGRGVFLNRRITPPLAQPQLLTPPAPPPPPPQPIQPPAQPPAPAQPRAPAPDLAPAQPPAQPRAPAPDLAPAPFQQGAEMDVTELQPSALQQNPPLLAEGGGLGLLGQDLQNLYIPLPPPSDPYLGATQLRDPIYTRGVGWNEADGEDPAGAQSGGWGEDPAGAQSGGWGGAAAGATGGGLDPHQAEWVYGENGQTRPREAEAGRRLPGSEESASALSGPSLVWDRAPDGDEPGVWNAGAVAQSGGWAGGAGGWPGSEAGGGWAADTRAAAEGVEGSASTVPTTALRREEPDVPAGAPGRSPSPLRRENAQYLGDQPPSTLRGPGNEGGGGRPGGS